MKKEKKKYKYEEVVEYAKKILPKVKSRIELVQKVAKHFNLSPNTIDSYFRDYGFRTGFKSSGGSGEAFKKMWKEIKEGKREPPSPKQVLISSSLKILKKIYERPRFGYEFNKLEQNLIYGTLRRHGLVKVFRFTHRTFGSKKTRYGNLIRTKGTIYFLPHQTMQVYNMLKEVFGEDLNKQKKSILKALGIPFYSKKGYYYHKETGEML